MKSAIGYLQLNLSLKIFDTHISPVIEYMHLSSSTMKEKLLTLKIVFFQSISRSTNQAVNQPVSQSVNQSVYHPVSQLINLLVNYSHDQSFSQLCVCKINKLN